MLAAGGEFMPPSQCARNMWIVKPEKLLGGQGIELASSVAEVAAVLDRAAAAGLRTAEGGIVAPGANWVVQKYVERPLLLGGRKFDVRVLALVTDAWDVYVYEHGFCRLTSAPYSLERGGGGAAAASAAASASAAAASSDFSAGAGFSKVAHITNHCYQVTASEYGAHEPSNLLSFDQLQTALDLRLGAGALSVRGQLWPRWAEAILEMLSAARGAAEAGAAPPGGGRRHWFEIIGVDFVVDEHFRSWLIEANTTPGLEGHCAYADAVYARVVEDAYCLVVDPLFPLQPAGAAPPPLADAAYDDCVVAALPWAARVARAPLPAWAATPWGDVPCPAPAPHRGNRWQLVWSEAVRELRAIPHQAAMAGAADTAAAVDAMLAAEAAGGSSGDGCSGGSGGGSGTAALASRIAAEHGLLPLLRAIQQTRTAAEEELLRGASAADGAADGAAGHGGGCSGAAEGAPPPLHWKPVVRRYIRRVDAGWVYPLGVPPGELAPLGETL